jgi:hypothetical protein
MSHPTISAYRFDTEHQPPLLLIWINDAETAAVEVDGVEVRLAGDRSARVGEVYLSPDADQARIRATIDGMISSAVLTWPPDPPPPPSLPPRRRPRLRVAS